MAAHAAYLGTNLNARLIRDRVLAWLNLVTIISRMVTRRSFLHGLSVLLTSTAATPLISRKAAAAAVSYGWNENYDNGTVADWYVRGDVAVSGDGKSLATAFKTPAEALSAMSAGDTVMFKDFAGSYPPMDISAKGGVDANRLSRFLGYGTDKPTFKAALPLTGFVPCDIGDGSVVGLNWARIYKKTGFSIALISGGNISAMNLHENGVALNEAISRANDGGDPFFTQNPDTWWDADQVYQSEDKAATVGEVVVGYKDHVTDFYTRAQIENADILIHVHPNMNERVAIDAFSEPDGIIRITTSRTYENVNANRFALINLIPAISQGGFGYVDNGDGTCDVYVWPNDPANIATGIEYSHQSRVIYTGSADYFEICGLRVVQAASAIRLNNGCGIATSTGAGDKKQRAVIRHVYSGGHLSTTGNGYGGIFIGNVDDLLLEYITIENVRGMFGLFVAGGSSTYGSADPAMRGTFRNLHIVHAEQSGLRFYTQREAILCYSKIERCGKASHANKFNWYEQCYDVLNWGIKFEECGGYATCQEADNIYWAFCYIPASGGRFSRAFKDQNHSSAATPGTYLGNQTHCYIFNCTFAPSVDNLDYPFNLSVGSNSNPTVLWEYYNNVIHNDDDSQIAYIFARDYNIYTRGKAVGFNSLTSDHHSVYRDPIRGDFSFRLGGPVSTFVGRDMRDVIASVLEPRFGDRFTEWSKDIDGNRFDWTDAPVGHLVQRA